MKKKTETAFKAKKKKKQCQNEIILVTTHR